jgi:hypothetical protein
MGRGTRTGAAARFQASYWLRTVGWVAAILLTAGVGLGLGLWLFPKAGDGPDVEEAVIRYPRVLEKLPQYQNVDDIDFLHSLDRPELFGDDHGS